MEYSSAAAEISVFSARQWLLEGQLSRPSQTLTGRELSKMCSVFFKKFSRNPVIFSDDEWGVNWNLLSLEVFRES